MSDAKVALLAGVGPGLGASLARRFARGGYSVGLVARRRDFIAELANEICSTGGKAAALNGDVSEPGQVRSLVAQVVDQLGPIHALIYNASSANREGLLGTTSTQFENAWRVASLGGFCCAQETAPAMIKAGAGVMLFTGATSSVRGGRRLAFSSAKFALRGLVQSLALELWPKGIHVAHVIVDGIIGEAGTASPNELELDPNAMAEAYWQLAQQSPFAWSLEIDLRPHREKFFE
jgi:NAD(P)-dependent dehydrogenase (short-subunit alcohol dehydrogenase family)